VLSLDRQYQRSPIIQGQQVLSPATKSLWGREVLSRIGHGTATSMKTGGGREPLAI
jgi:hypothetical protein